MLTGKKEQSLEGAKFSSKTKNRMYSVLDLKHRRGNEQFLMWSSPLFVQENVTDIDKQMDSVLQSTKQAAEQLEREREHVLEQLQKVRHALCRKSL